MRSLFALAALIVLTAAAPASDPLLEQVLAGARAVPPASISFERTQRSTSKEEDKAPETRVRVDRWDGRQLSLISINGKPPTPQEAEDFRKASAGRPIPGYYRLASYFGQGARRVPDAKGRIIYRVDKLPKGSINIGRDISANVTAEAIVDTSGPKPFVSRVRITLPKPVSFFMVAKLDTFEAESEYRLGSDGRPVLVHNKQTMSGAQMGTSGVSSSESRFEPLR